MTTPSLPDPNQATAQGTSQVKAAYLSKPEWIGLGLAVLVAVLLAWSQVRSQAVSGYAGGEAADASYGQVAQGRTGHAESVKVAFDPQQVSFAQLQHIFFAVAPNTALPCFLKARPCNRSPPSGR